MQPMKRIQGNIVNRLERRFLNWACEAMPSAVTSDHLTLFGIFGAVLVCAGYLCARVEPGFLWLSMAGYVIHWFGDSLDGSLARYRNVARPKYGYFLDHSVDAFCILVMIGSMGLTPFVRLDVALFVVLGYFALSIHVFLKNHVTGTFQLSFLALGPTELRIFFMLITGWMFVAGTGAVHVAGPGVSDYDIAMLVIGGAFVTLFVGNTVAMIVHLRALEGNGRVRQRASDIDEMLTSVSRGRGSADTDGLQPAAPGRTVY